MNSHKDRPVIIMGAGGHATVLVDALRQCDYRVLGVTDPNISRGASFCGIDVLGGDDIIFSFDPNEISLVNGLGSLPGQFLRWKLADTFRNQRFSFLTVVHPSATVGANVQLGEGVQVMSGVILQPGVCVGKDSIINTGVIVDHDCTIGAKTHLAPGVTISGGVHVEEGVHIGTGASVIQNIKIGKGAVIAAGAIIYKDIPDGQMHISYKK